MMASLKDIAEKLDLSKTTVSWILSGKGPQKGLSEATIQKVVKCAKEMDYQPNLLARSLNIGRTKTIGLILPSISDYFYSQIAYEVEMEAEKHGYSLMICNSESDINRENSMINLFKAKRVDGIILAPTKRSRVEVQKLVTEAYPLVTFDRYFPELAASYVIINNWESSYQLTKHLLQKGYRKIAIITTNSHLITMNHRKEGYEDAIRESGKAIDPDLYGEVDFKDYEKKIIPVLDLIFEKVPDIDSFFFTTHILALEAFLYFHNRKITKSFGMASIHGVSTFKILAPHINVAWMPIDKIGQTAVNMLIEKIEGKKDTLSNESKNNNGITLPCSLELE